MVSADGFHSPQSNYWSVGDDGALWVWLTVVCGCSVDCWPLDGCSGQELNVVCVWQQLMKDAAGDEKVYVSH